MAESDLFCEIKHVFHCLFKKNKNQLQFQKIQTEKQITGLFYHFWRPSWTPSWITKNVPSRGTSTQNFLTLQTFT